MHNRLEKRETAKCFPLINHWKLGICAILAKETNGKYGLIWWGINKWETLENALIRELWEELGKNNSIEKKKKLTKIETKTQIHNIFAVKINGSFEISRNGEVKWLAFYPLESQFQKERQALHKNLEYHAQKTLELFRKNHQRTTYETSNISIDGKFFDQFHKELLALLK